MRGRVPLATGPRRGALALGFAIALLLIAFITTSSFLLAVLAAGTRAEHALAETQALYAAEAGLDLAAQAGAERLVGECGRGRFAVQRVGGELRALGQVARPSGAPIRAAVVLTGATWRQVPPAGYPELAAMLAEEGAAR